jgi:hypothetical protein
VPPAVGCWHARGASRIPLFEMVRLGYLCVATWSLRHGVRVLLRTVSSVRPRRRSNSPRVSPATKLALAKAPTNAHVLQPAVGEIPLKLRIAPAETIARLQALGKVPPADLAFLQVNGPKVQQGATRLKSVSTVPPGDLAYLQANAAEVAKATQDNPGQWQTWWWICFIGQLVFIPLVCLLTGHWSPHKAREDELAHEKMAERELARLQAERSTTGEGRGCRFDELSAKDPRHARPRRPSDPRSARSPRHAADA